MNEFNWTVCYLFFIVHLWMAIEKIGFYTNRAETLRVIFIECPWIAWQSRYLGEIQIIPFLYALSNGILIFRNFAVILKSWDRVVGRGVLLWEEFHHSLNQENEYKMAADNTIVLTLFSDKQQLKRTVIDWLLWKCQ